MNSSIWKKIKLIICVVYGLFIKYLVDINLLNYGFGLNQNIKREKKVIVSLTSYGRRVDKIVKYTIISILRQTYKPDLIILWLDSWQWNDNNIPICLRELTKYGLTIRYSDMKLKSYKKLVHAISEYPNDIIITVDDDMFYRYDTIERLVNAYEDNPNRIYTNLAHQILFNGENLLPYNQWKHDQKNIKGGCTFMLGVGACLYTSHLLHEDLTNYLLYTKLAPNADDVWFFFMALLKNTPRVALNYTGNTLYPLDLIYQYRHSNSSLNAMNCGLSQNDAQIRNVMDYYHITSSDIINSK